MRAKRTAAFFFLLLVSLLWGAASPVVKHTLQWFDPWLFLTYRFTISTLIAFPYLAATKTPIPNAWSTRWLVILTGVISAPLSLFLFFEALHNTTALSGSLITAAGPLFLVVGGAFFFHDRITKMEKIGITVALFGTILTVVGPSILNGHADTLGKLEGNGIMLLAVIADALGALLSKSAMKKGVSATLLAQSQFIIGLTLFLPFLFLHRTATDVWIAIAAAPWQAHAGVLYMAVLSGTVAYSLRNLAVKTIEVSESALFTYLQPLWAALLAVIWLREAITPSYILGGIIIAAGVIIAERKKPRPR